MHGRDISAGDGRNPDCVPQQILHIFQLLVPGECPGSGGGNHRISLCVYRVARFLKDPANSRGAQRGNCRNGVCRSVYTSEITRRQRARSHSCIRSERARLGSCGFRAGRTDFPALAVYFGLGLPRDGSCLDAPIYSILGPMVYSFAAMLAVYLGATAVGSNRYRNWVRRERDVGEHLASGVAAILAGACAFLPLLATDPRIRAHAEVNSMLLIVCGIGPFCAVAGFMTPMLVDRWSRGIPNRAGRAYAVNALGCILGPLLAGFVLLPAVGERWTLVVLALPFFGFGVWSLTAGAITRACESRRALGMLLAAAAVASVLLVALTRDLETLYPGARVRRDYTATSIATGQGMRRRLLVNGIGMTVLTPIAKMMAHLPMASLPAPPRKALVLCFGMGTSFRSALSWDAPVTAVELVPSVPSLFGYFHADGEQLLRSPHARVVIDDARRFLERTPETFDVIIIDPPPPIESAGSSLLYSTEFYRVARSHLRPGGILEQWLPGGDATVTSAFARSLWCSFRDVRVFGSMEGWGYHFMASASPMARLPVSTIAKRLPPTAARDLIEWDPTSSVVSQFESVFGREQQIQDLIRRDPSAPLLTDDRPVNEYFLLRQIARRWASATGVDNR